MIVEQSFQRSLRLANFRCCSISSIQMHNLPKKMKKKFELGKVARIAIRRSHATPDQREVPGKSAEGSLPAARRFHVSGRP